MRLWKTDDVIRAKIDRLRERNIPPGEELEETAMQERRKVMFEFFGNSSTKKPWAD